MSAARSTQTRVWLWLLIVPLTMLGYSIGQEAYLGPAGVGIPDPGYHYLFDGLNLLEGYPLQHIEHPGTPVQVLSAVSIRSIYAASGSGDIVSDLIARPKVYITGFFILLMAIYCAALSALGFAVWQTTRSIGAAMVVQALPLIIGNSSWLRPVTAECLLATAVALLLTAIVRATDENGTQPLRRAVVFGAVVGFGLSVKLTFAPVAIVALVLLRTPKQFTVFAGAVAIAFLLCTSPIWPQYPRLANWVFAIAARDGARRYGNSAGGLAPFSRWLVNLIQLVIADPVFAILLLAGASVTARQIFLDTVRARQWMARDRLLAGLVLCGIVQFLLTANQPESYYLFAARATSGLLLWLLIERLPWFRRSTADRWLRALGLLFPTGLVAVGLLAWLAWPSLNADAAAIRDQLDTRYADSPKVFYAGASSAAFALVQGNLVSDGRYTEAMSRKYPGVYFYNGWEGMAGLCDWGGKPITLTQIATDGAPVVFVGNHLVPDDHGALSLPWGEVGLWRPPPVRLEEVFRRGDESIYTAVDSEGHP